MNGLVFLAVLFLSGAALASPSQKPAAPVRLPLRFEENHGQASRSDARYVARAGDFEFDFGDSETELRWAAPGKPVARVRTRMAGANSGMRIEPVGALSGKTNYFLGSGNWRTDVPAYGGLRYRDVYPGIDLVFHAGGGQLEYDFVVANAADPGRIKLAFSGQRNLRVDSDGDLVIDTVAGEIRWKRPRIYQEAAGARREVSGRFAVTGDSAGFEVGSYDRTAPLVIDPTLSYLTYLGGSVNDVGQSVALDAVGNVYIAGLSSSPNLPVASAYQSNLKGATANFFSGDAFVAKFSPSGTLLYLTYLGGSQDDGAFGIAVDAAGNAYLTGFTTSTDFPMVNPYQGKPGGAGGTGVARMGDAFIAKLGPAGNQLLYSTYFGGRSDDFGSGIALDKSGNILVAGSTQSANFQVTDTTVFAGSGGEPPVDCCNAPLLDSGDAFLIKLDPTGSKLLFSTLLGGSADDAATSIAVDFSGNAYIAGYTLSPNFRTTPGAMQRTFGGIEEQNFFVNTGDAFIAKYDPSGVLQYSTYFGGAGDDWIWSLATDPAGNLYMTGASSTTNLKTTPGVFQPRYAGYVSLPFTVVDLTGDAFVAELNPAGTQFVYLTYLGGSENDLGTSIAVDSTGAAYVAGWTNSSDFPVVGNQSSFGGGGGEYTYMQFGDGFVARIAPGGKALDYCAFVGGSADDVLFGVATDNNGNVYFAGSTVSGNLKTTPTAVQSKFAGTRYSRPSYVMGDAVYGVFTGFPAGTPVITEVANAEGESPAIAPNSWILIKGAALAASSRIWGNSDFANNQMPTALDNVIVTLNGEPAYVYYISGTQINALTPPDLAPGGVNVVVSVNGVPSAPFVAQVQPLSESFFVFNGGPYIAAVHLNGTLVGPPGLLGPAVLTTPAKPGEEISLYMNGFGPTNPAVTKGLQSQSGNLPTFPMVTIGGIQANVIFAALVSPGLFQFNIYLPSGLSNSDNQIKATYNGSTTQAGTLLTVQQ